MVSILVSTTMLHIYGEYTYICIKTDNIFTKMLSHIHAKRETAAKFSNTIADDAPLFKTETLGT